MSELGGGPHRVRQRLRTTLQWCQDKSYLGLTLDASPQELAESWRYRDPAHSPAGSAYAHHKTHAQRIQFISHEIGLSRDLRKGLLTAAMRTAASARTLVLKNTSDCKNRSLTLAGESYSVDYVKADRLARRSRIDTSTRKYMNELVELQSNGWFVVYLTIILPRSARPSTSSKRIWGLAGSPDAAKGAEVLLKIQRAALPSKHSSKLVAGFWRLQLHDCEQVHLHAPLAFPNLQEFELYLQRLNDAYFKHTNSLRNLKIIGGFGIGLRVEDNAIDVQILDTADDIKRVVSYSLRQLDVDVDLTPVAHRYAAFGALTSKPRKNIAASQNPKKDGSEAVRIKHYMDLPYIHLIEVLACQNFTLGVFSPVNSRPSLLLPPARAPPPNYNGQNGQVSFYD